MAITIESKNLSEDMGYGGFFEFRKKVAALTNEKFGEHYENLKEGTFLFGDETVAFFKKYDAKTQEFIKSSLVTPEIANFCYQTDCKGSIDQRQAQQIYEKIKNYNDDVRYGCGEDSDCAMFADLKAIFKDCVENGGKIEWA